MKIISALVTHTNFTKEVLIAKFFEKFRIESLVFYFCINGLDKIRRLVDLSN